MGRFFVFVALTVFAGGCASTAYEETGVVAGADPVTHEDRARGVSVTVPDGWHVAGGVLATGLFDPREILSLGTYGLEPNGPDDEPGNMPARALRALPPDGAFVSVQERGAFEAQSLDSETLRREYPPRPASFGLTEARRMDGRTAHEDPTWWIPFSDAGRAFYLMVAIGRDAPPTTREAVRRATDSLRFATGKTYGIGPWVRAPADWRVAQAVRDGMVTMIFAKGASAAANLETLTPGPGAAVLWLKTTPARATFAEHLLATRLRASDFATTRTVTKPLESTTDPGGSLTVTLGEDGEALLPEVNGLLETARLP